MGTPSRRDVLRWGLLGGGAAPIAAWLSGCASDDTTAPATTERATSTSAPATAAPTTAAPSTSTATTTVPASAPPATAAIDPSRPWWMQGNFAPVTSEVEQATLTVRGAIPPELTGTYVRNGSNPASGDSPHWFFGDGMVHGVHVERGEAVWYRNRYVRTPLYDGGLGFGQGAPGGASNQSNVSAIWHGGRLLTSGEVGFPYELSARDLSTVGPHDFGGALTSSFTAHPKIDPVTGRLHSFGYGFTPPYLTYHVTEPDGTMVHTEAIELPNSTMIHDFAITETDAVFWDLPVVFDIDAAIAYIENPASGAFPYRWTPEAGARIGVMPLAGGADQLRWFDIEPCYVFHGVNAFRRGDQVVLDVCRLSRMFAEGDLFGGEASLRRWTVDTATGSVTDDVLETENPGDLPSRDPRVLGRDYRYGYLAGTRENDATVDLGGLIKHDVRDGTRVTWDPGPTSHTGEWLFVPAGSDPAEDAGWLFGFVHDDATDTTELAIVDATDVGAGPVARIELPQRVPYGFHATWIPG
ncbi:MAG: carotenoid oxygenase family protein [Acidimicrobiales bacterium]|nr:carotenoid oxygenase family protein [Acidimicrobiales bacterium]MCB9393506.1 carotenoid oxygenase family protein [Acidimicrobiaceae bacterium]